MKSSAMTRLCPSYNAVTRGVQGQASVRRVTTIVASCAGALALAGSAAAATPLVPAAVQAQIASRAVPVAYVPARGVAPYRYRSWTLRAGVLRIRFANRDEPKKLVVFEARPFHGVCRSGMQRSFQMAGVKVWASRSASRGRAWRCVHGTKLIAWSTLPERRFALVGLARIAASGHALG
jgi:hypothetical protein